jgi:uncharacterized repeat protein (TIGR03803 family)
VKLSLGKTACIVIVFCAAGGPTAFAQTFTSLARFETTNGAHPTAPLVQGITGDFYGTATAGGANHNSGTVFKMTPAGVLTKIYSFCSQADCADGEEPYAGLVQVANGNFYGTTITGGAHVNANCFDGGGGCGTVFEITPTGKLTTLYSFCSLPNCTDGYSPGGLVQASNGNFYGITGGGGTTISGCDVGCGTVFEITPEGELTTIYNFCSQTDCADGSSPVAGLVQGSNGNFYGVTLTGGANDYGDVFEVSPNGKLDVLHSFVDTEADPESALVQGTNGSLYGTTNSLIYEITPLGKFTILHEFEGSAGGIVPMGRLIQATDGNFYGTTYAGGANGAGTVFEITPAGALTTLYSFCSQSGCADGQIPIAGLLQGTDGAFYGTTSDGGDGICAMGCGTMFSLSTGIAAFVETLPAARAVGDPITILGNNLTGATSLTFNGTEATFTVASDTAIKTTVPAGATTGTVEVVTPSGTLTSNVPFRVIP